LQAHDEAVTVLLRAYGPEVLGFLVAVHGSQIEREGCRSGFCRASAGIFTEGL